MQKELIINFFDQKSRYNIRVLYSNMGFTDKATSLVNCIISKYTDICKKNKKHGIRNVIIALEGLGSSFYVEQGSKMAPLYIERLKYLCGTAQDFCYADNAEKGLISVLETDNFEMGVKTSNRINLVVNEDGTIFCKDFTIIES